MTGTRTHRLPALGATDSRFLSPIVGATSSHNHNYPDRLYACCAGPDGAVDVVESEDCAGEGEEVRRRGRGEGEIHFRKGGLETVFKSGCVKERVYGEDNSGEIKQKGFGRGFKGGGTGQRGFRRGVEEERGINDSVFGTGFREGEKETRNEGVQESIFIREDFRLSLSGTRRGEGRGGERQGGGRREGGGERGRRGGTERRRLPGVGSYVIDTPTDTALGLRQRFLSFQKQHRGVTTILDDSLPDIPFRLNPRLEVLAAMSPPRSILKVDAATSPMTLPDDDSNASPRLVESPAPSTPRTVTFAPDTDVTSVKAKRPQRNTTNRVSTNYPGQNISVSTNSTGVGSQNMSSKTTETSSLSKPFSFRESRTPRHARSVRECTKLSLCSLDAARDHVTERLWDFPKTSRTNWSFSSSRKKSSSLSDLADLGNSLHDKLIRSSDIKLDNFGPSSFSRGKKSKSLLDLMHVQEEKHLDLGVYHKRQRIAHLAFRKENSFRQHSTLSSEDADKEWLDMVKTKVVDNTDYDKFASRRKPLTPVKKQGKSSTPKSSLDFKTTQAANGKVFPVFFNDGMPVRKFGRTLHRRKPSKVKS